LRSCAGFTRKSGRRSKPPRRSKSFWPPVQPPGMVSANNEAEVLMSSCLDHVTDWAALAKFGSYCAAKLAFACGVTPRQPERYFQTWHHVAPHRCLRSLRMRLAVELIRDQTPLQVVAIDLGYQEPAHFTHDVKGYFGVSPSCSSQNPPLAVAGRQNVASVCIVTPVFAERHQARRSDTATIRRLLLINSVAAPQRSALAAGSGHAARF
jgi:AraC-like DNA-binding protein